MLEYIRNELLGMTDKGEYAAFTSSLIPGCDNIIGIRQPVLKQYAKQLIKENKDFRKLLSEPDIYQEETLLRSYIIGMGTAKEKDFKKALKDFNTFVPLVNNWAVNDSFCVEFRVMDMFRDEFLPYIKECIESFDEYRARVGLIMLLDHYLKVDMHGMKRPRMKKVTIKDIESTDEINCANGLYLDDIFSLVNRDFSAYGYYTQMAAGWLLAECFVTFPKRTWEYLTDTDCLKLDKLSYKKAVRKICESLTPDKEVKLKVKKDLKQM